MTSGVLIFFCGKMGAGKSTRSREYAQERNAVLLSEDEWLAAIYPDSIKTLSDYVTYSGRLKPQIKKLVQSMLLTGTNVVMDFPANTVAQRAWFKGLFSEVQAEHELVYIDRSDATCLAHIAQRRKEQPHRATTDTAEMFEQVNRHFVAPRPEEGFNTTVIAADS